MTPAKFRAQEQKFKLRIAVVNNLSAAFTTLAAAEIAFNKAKATHEAAKTVLEALDAELSIIG